MNNNEQNQEVVKRVLMLWEVIEPLVKRAVDAKNPNLDIALTGAALAETLARFSCGLFADQPDVVFEKQLGSALLSIMGLARSLRKAEKAGNNDGFPPMTGLLQ